MAKYKSKGIGHKQFFTLSVLAVSVLGLIFVTSAVQQPTNTQSDASGSICVDKPELTFLNATGEDKRPLVQYFFRVTNNSTSACNRNLKFRVIVKPPSSGWDYSLFDSQVNYFESTDTHVLKPGGKFKFSASVFAPNSAPFKKYYFPIKVCYVNKLGGTETDKCDKIDLMYNKTVNWPYQGDSGT